jgi:preprotein translocase subunit SecD
MATPSRNRSHPLRTLIIFALIIIAFYLIIGINNMTSGWGWTPKLGLDLKGGITVTLTAVSENADGSVSAESLEQAKNIMESRVNGMGVTEAEVSTSGEKQIIVSAPNVDREQLVSQVGQTAQLYFRKVFAYQLSTNTSNPQDSSSSDETTGDETGESDEITIEPDEGEGEAEGEAEASIEPTTEGEAEASVEPTTESDAGTEPEASESPKANSGPPLPGLPTPVPSPRPTVAGTETQTTDKLLEFEPSDRDYSDFAAYQCGDTFPNVTDQPYIACDSSGYYKYLLGPALISGTELTAANAVVPQNSVNWMVTLSFNDTGATAFEKVTANLATLSDPKNQFGIVLDKVVISAPKVEETIAGGNAQITGSFSSQEAADLANVLKYGALPLTFDVSDADEVSAKLGGEQLSAGLIAGLIGLALVVIYSIIYYRALAVVVVASLGIAGGITWALLVILGEGMGYALNLPGIAGAIVAIGVTADSFIIYFERIRDEARDGRTLRTAIETGWVRSRKTILVADSVSLLSALVLWILAIGSVKGFAFTLGLTTLIDIAIVFFFTKPLVTLLGRTKFFGEGRRFSGFEAEHIGAKTPLTALALRGGGH